MKTIQLVPAAEADFKGIWKYTAKTWSPDQADRYLNQLADGFETLANGTAFSRTVELFPKIGSLHCQHHYIFFRETAETIQILAVLHERMDLLTRLQHRLKNN